MKIAIAGFGIEGRENYRYFHKLYPDAEMVIVHDKPVDDLPEGVEYLAHQDFLDGNHKFDLILRSPSFRPDLLLPRADKVWSATNEFFAKCPAKIIGVTGTKGKGTTSSLIASVLRSAGKTVHLVGNIGVPALEVLPDIKPDDIVVYELSSFQLWDIERSPHIAVVLMIEPDHLDVHKDFEEYVGAKSNITKHQSADDVVIYHPANEYSRQISHNGGGKKQRYGVADDGGVYVASDEFFALGNPICGVDKLHLIGRHNYENACAAISVALAIAPQLTNQQIAKGLLAFDGLPHRLKFVREVNGVKYYDDSIATTPGSAIASLRAFDEPKIIILGGSNKGADYQQIVATAKEVSARVIAIGQTGQKIFDLCRSYEVAVEKIPGLMDEVVQKATDMANTGDVVILSPASASFDQYKSYADRGDQFIAAVESL